MSRIPLLLLTVALLSCNDTDTKTDGDDTLDADGDGLTDLEEADYGTDPLEPDSDFDGFEDLEEIEYGTDPLDIYDHPYNAGWDMDIECRHSIVPTHEDGSNEPYRVGDIVNNFESIDQMGGAVPEKVRLHDFCDHYVLLVSSGFG